MEKKEVDTAVNRLAEATNKLEDIIKSLGEAVNKLTSLAFIIMCSMAICCILLSIVIIFM